MVACGSCIINISSVKHLTDLLCSEVLKPPLDGAVRGYLEPRGSDLYSSRIASCTGTKGKASKTTSIVKKRS